MPFHQQINRPFENIINYALISGYPELFANETIQKCVVLGWGKNKFGYPNIKASVASVRVKYGPNACKVPPDKYVLTSK